MTAVIQNGLPMAMPFSFYFGPSAAGTATNSRWLARRPCLRRQETLGGKEPGAVAPKRHAAYILVTFQSSLMTLSGFARTGGRSAEEIYQWRPRP
jgi:hypothetical protein